MPDNDQTAMLQASVQAALAAHQTLCIRAGGSKGFYGRQVAEAVRGEQLDLSQHCGIISYEPGELVLRARAGTPLAEIEAALADNNQCLPFEPPHFGTQATLGGTVACGLSGPARPWRGAARDLVLGTQIINGRGEVLRFGGEVMKNVAGYDVSRLMCGALGTLGVLLDVSLKVLPKAESTTTLKFELDPQAAQEKIARIARTAAPLTAAAHCDGQLYLRLAGARAGVDAARATLGGELCEKGAFWHALREQTLPFFSKQSARLWRLACAPATPFDAQLGKQLIDWGGAQRWFFSDSDPAEIRAQIAASGGHALCFRHTGKACCDAVFQPLTATQKALNTAVKAAFDPQGIFNPQRMYAD